MKHYEGMVFVPASESGGYFEVRQFGFSPFKETYKLETNVIVLTIEELREVYNAGGWARCAQEEGEYSHTLETFLKSKNINI